MKKYSSLPRIFVGNVPYPFCLEVDESDEIVQSISNCNVSIIYQTHSIFAAINWITIELLTITIQMENARILRIPK
jgi:hypothetical protein